MISYMLSPGTGKPSLSDKKQTNSCSWELEIDKNKALLRELGAFGNVLYLFLDGDYTSVGAQTSLIEHVRSVLSLYKIVPQ